MTELLEKVEKAIAEQNYARFLGLKAEQAEEGKVVITIKQEADDLIFSVSDTGCGIPSEDIPNMFQRFSQGTSQKRSAGTGLGLYLSRQIIEAHDGKIWAESEDGYNTFFVQLAIHN